MQSITPQGKVANSRLLRIHIAHGNLQHILQSVLKEGHNNFFCAYNLVILLLFLKVVQQTALVKRPEVPKGLH